MEAPYPIPPQLWWSRRQREGSVGVLECWSNGTEYPEVTGGLEGASEDGSEPRSHVFPITPVLQHSIAQHSNTPQAGRANLLRSLPE